MTCVSLLLRLLLFSVQLISKRAAAFECSYVRVRNLGVCLRHLPNIKKRNKRKKVWMKIPPKWSNCPRTPRRPTAVRFHYPWWRGSKAQQAGMLSVREVIRRADVFSPIVEEPFCFISASKFQIRREHWQTHREGSIPFLSVLPDRMRNSERTFHLRQTSARHPDCCYQA